MIFALLAVCILAASLVMMLVFSVPTREKEQEDSPSIYDQRAALGALVLDKTIPGWFKRINCQRLDIAVNECCIAGQLFGSFNDCWALRFSAVERGMHLSNEEATRENFDKLTAAWKREIEARLAARGPSNGDDETA